MRGSADKKEKDIKRAETCCWELLMISSLYTALVMKEKMRREEENSLNDHIEINATGK